MMDREKLHKMIVEEIVEGFLAKNAGDPELDAVTDKANEIATKIVNHVYE